MQSHNAGQIRLEGGKAALRPGDDGGGLYIGIGFQHRVQRFPLPGLVHEKAKLLLVCHVQRVGVFSGPAHLRDDPPAGLLGGLLGDALPALQLLFRFVRLGHAAVRLEEHDLRSPGLHAFLNDIVGSVPLGKAAEHRHLYGRLRRAGDDLDHLGLNLLPVRLH